ncbi:MAG: M20/M25/M40 family metallo-hydrolase [Gemmatimonadaceae bacterium]|nr:M20/M25/M40 family metallo-hydrolase [Gemmatimonadaceae bacterium]
MSLIRTFAFAALAPAALLAQAPASAAAPSVPNPAPMPTLRAELPRTHAPRPTSPAITAADLMTRLYIFADDSMQGRETGTPGHERGLRYIEGELARLGLKPLGENGTFRQTVGLVKRGWNTDFTVSAGGSALTAWEDVVPIPARGSTPRSVDGATAVFAGTFEEAAKLADSVVAGRLVVVRSPGGLRLPRLANTPLAKAAGLAVVIGVPVPANFLAFFRQPSVGMPPKATEAAVPTPTSFVLSPKGVQALFGTRIDSLTVGQVGRTFATTLAFTESPAPSYNLVAVLPGSDPALRGQYVAVGGHSDHVGFTNSPVDHDSLKAYQREAWWKAGAYAGLPPLPAAARSQLRVNLDSLRRIRPARPDSISNGADDDGSGSMAVLEIAEQLARAKKKPRRSVLFVWHTGEEKGLLGAEWLSEHLPVALDSVVAQVNIDMLGRGDAVDVKGGGPAYVGLVGSRRLSTMLGDMIDTLNAKRKQKLDIDYRLDANGHPENIYCRSDHYHYARLGIPVAFFFTGLHGDYHQVTDEPQYIDYPHYATLTNFIRDVVVATANGPRPVVDKPKLDPNGPCRQ